MRFRGLYLITGGALLFAWGATSAQASATATDARGGYPADATVFTNQVVDLTNKERISAGLSSLASNALLQISAQGHAEAMAAGNFFDHVNPITGSEPKDRITAAGYKWSAIGENIAAGQARPEEVVQSWMSSPGHRANILRPDFTEIGVGYAQNSNTKYGTFWVQNFGTPAIESTNLAATTPVVTSVSLAASPAASPGAILSAPAGSSRVVMAVSAEPREANVEAPISVSITLSGDSTSCGQSVVVKPVDVILVLDHSGSMQGEPLAQAKEASKAFVDQMDLKQDRVGVVQFDDSAQLIQGLGSDAKIIGTSIDAIPSGGGTSISDGIKVAFDALNTNKRPSALPVIVLLSDGQSDPISAYFVAQNAKAAGINIVTVGLGDASPVVLKGIASTDKNGKPRYYEAPDPAGLKAIYVSIARDIREYGLAKDLALRFHLNLYDFALIPKSLEKDSVVAGDTITWNRDVLSSGTTTFSFQVWGRKPGEYDIGSLTDATFLECEQTNSSLQLPAGPNVSLKDVPPKACTAQCPWWLVFPWWLLVTLLFLALVVYLLRSTRLGNFIKSDRVWCKLLWSLFYAYLVLLVGLSSYSLLGRLCAADQVYFWRVSQDGNVGIFRTQLGEAGAEPIQHLNQGSNCVACHALGGSAANPVLAAVRDAQNGDIVAHSLNGGDIPIPPLNGSYMAFSPDGKKLAVSFNDRDIQILDVATGMLTPLAGASDPGVIETMPAWSPDGQVIAFVRAASVPKDSARIDVPCDIYTVPAGGGIALPLPGASGEGFNYYPSYSPNGKWLAFTRHLNGQDTYGDNASDIYLVPAQGGNRILLRANNDQWADTWPTWSSDGRTLGFSSDRKDEQYDVLLTNIGSNGQSGEACLLTGAAQPTSEEFHPIWLKTNNLPWWQRLIGLWPWLVPLPVLLGAAFLACRPKMVTIRTTHGVTGEPIGGVTIKPGSKQ